MGKEKEEEKGREKENKMGKHLQQYLNSCKEDKIISEQSTEAKAECRAC